MASSLFPVSISLLLFGVVMVASASLPTAVKLDLNPMHFVMRQALYACIGVGIGAAVLHIPLVYWEKVAPYLLMASALLLVMVLIPQVGVKVNNAYRWLPLGPFRLQPSEVAKISAILYLAGYLVRHHTRISHDFFTFVRPLVLLAIIAFLILLEPDLGGAAVLMLIAVWMMFMAGVHWGQFMLLTGVGGLAFGGAIYFSDYRWQRVIAFFQDPFELDPMGKNFQTTQALISFARGGLDGMGLGEGLQKHLYLPEAHTDFIFSVIGEEFGLIGSLLLIALYAVLALKGVWLANSAIQCKQYFSAYLAYGVTTWITLQAMLNMAVNMNIFPTTGITLPLISYGGSGLIVMMAAIAMLMRVEYELCPVIRAARMRSKNIKHYSSESN